MVNQNNKKLKLILNKILKCKIMKKFYKIYKNKLRIY